MLDILRPVRRLRAGLARLQGWQAGLAAFALGLFSVLGFAPLFWVGAYALSLCLLFFLLEGSRRVARSFRSGFFRSWCFGVGMFLAGLWWIANAFFERGGAYAWFFWVPVILMPVGLALFWGLAGGIYTRWGGKGPARLAVFVAALGFMEFMRSTILSGFPWNLPAHVWSAGGAMSQTASLAGVPGLSLITLALFILPVLLFERTVSWVRYGVPFAGLVLFVSLLGWGHARIASTQIEPSDQMVRVVQLSLPQSERIYERREDILQSHLELSDLDNLEAIDAVIWPEGAIPALLLRDTDLIDNIQSALPVGTTLITGTTRAETQGDDAWYYNSLAVLNREEAGLRLTGMYDKTRLVPFGEGNPVLWLTRPLGFESLSRNSPFYLPGDGATVINASGLSTFQPLICYEVIYPGYTRQSGLTPEWLLNISNDSWYGQTTGPYQHLNIARYRAIETGLPLVRSASAGVSGLIDPLGRGVQLSDIKSSQALDIHIPKPLDETLYKEYGNLPWVSFVVFLLFLVQFRRLKN